MDQSGSGGSCSNQVLVYAAGFGTGKYLDGKRRLDLEE